MLSWSFAFFIIAIIAGMLGFTGVESGALQIAKTLFVVFLVLFLLTLLAGILLVSAFRNPKV